MPSDKVTLIPGDDRLAALDLAQSLCVGSRLMGVYLFVQGRPALLPDGWRVIEEPLDIAGIILAESQHGHLLLVDSLTGWVNNLIAAGRDLRAEEERLAGVLGHVDGPLILLAGARAADDAAVLMIRRMMAEAGHIVPGGK